MHTAIEHTSSVYAHALHNNYLVAKHHRSFMHTDALYTCKMKSMSSHVTIAVINTCVRSSLNLAVLYKPTYDSVTCNYSTCA